MEKSEEGMYSKFKALEYNKNDDFCSFWAKKSNCYFREILENSTLIAKKFGELNDVDECSYEFENLQLDIEKIYSTKNNKVICAFTDANNNNDLMWAHYANGSTGVKIDFYVDEKFEKFIKQVEYKPNRDCVCDTSENTITKIMCRKNKIWSYERERRAIFDSDSDEFKEFILDGNNFFPINISKITLGRKFCLSPNCRVYDPNSEKDREFDSNVIKVARFIYRVLKNNKKYSLKMPEIRAYKTKYSPEAFEITENLLENLA
ncbi:MULTISPECIES: hypothetical protein [unclassified Campylobacter]|uniref:hypothetical protein n=1 Tax=unclassified Campylobacter TaxID=2593542 RepID=UPI0022E9FBB6|nr:MULTISPECIES: hypothetical protein [unclassified Campylobacter]MDA3078973.1 hypothetical protein [Campylobacter sp. CS_NA2]MDA3080736.1 hypothetical protein [Campylobacter sp. CS_NA1]MDA3085060.1 hypothetical protein [Campylobacter sp. CS_ED1]MDA3089836.1 hypothetical protein [Campylobacter sp. CS_ED2]WBR51607.1 hypothetical protein PF026_01830 [Campylobacter sp. CS_NA3]